MTSADASNFKLSPTATIVGVTLLALAAAIAIGFFFANRPAGHSLSSRPSPETQEYARTGLHLSEVTMQATENFMNQRVVEVQGKITNQGNRALKAVTVYCIFSGIDGKEIHREPVAIVSSEGEPMKPRDSRDFRLPFDTLPDGWNQAIPAMVIADIVFAEQ